MKKYFEKRSKCLYIAVMTSVIYFIYQLCIYISMGYITNIKTTADYANSLYISVTFPSFIAIVIGMIFGIIGLNKKNTVCNIISILVMLISILLNPIYVFFTLPIFILQIIGTLEQGKINGIKTYKAKTTNKEIRILNAILLLILLFFILIFILFKEEIFHIFSNVLFNYIIRI